MGKFKKLFYGLFALTSLTALVFSYIFYQILYTQVLPPSQQFYYLYTKNSSTQHLAEALSKAGLLKDKSISFLFLKFYAKFYGLKAGEYLFIGPKNLSGLLNQMIEGKILKRQFTLVEGWNVKDIWQGLSRAPILKDDVYMLQARRSMKLNDMDSSFINAFNLKWHVIPINLEGLFYPASYQYIYDTSVKVLLKKAFDTMQTKLNFQWSHRDAQVTYQNPYQALIVASLIEKETSLNNEKPLVARVILNRLALNMPLQIDAAVIYGADGREGKLLTLKDLRIDSPYNTYLHKGLPPSPICMPSETSLYAALHPASSKALYYVANGQGGHYFSETYAEHINYVKKYRDIERIKQEH